MATHKIYKYISKLLEIISYYPEGYQICIRIINFKWISYRFGYVSALEAMLCISFSSILASLCRVMVGGGPHAAKNLHNRLGIYVCLYSFC